MCSRWRPVGPRRYLSGLQDIAVFIAEGDGDLPWMLIDSEVQHGWLSCWARKGGIEGIWG
jgi:hypothetical protein